jgi:uncharacterized protein (TIGR04255 family)
MADKNYEDIVYKQNPIKEVIIRIDFSNSIESFKENIPKKVFEEIKTKFPIAEVRENYINHVVIDKTEITKNKELLKEWVFHSNNNKLILNKNVLILSIIDYKTSKSLLKDFSVPWQAIRELINDQYIKRIGIRYINHIEAENNDQLKEFIIESIIPFELDTAFKFNPIKLSNSYEIKIEDSKLRFNYGLLNPNYPSPITNTIFVLDFDCFYDGLLEIDEVIEKIKTYHSYIQDLFEKSIKQPYRDILNG